MAVESSFLVTEITRKWAWEVVDHFASAISSSSSLAFISFCTISQVQKFLLLEIMQISVIKYALILLPSTSVICTHILGTLWLSIVVLSFFDFIVVSQKCLFHTIWVVLQKRVGTI